MTEEEKSGVVQEVINTIKGQSQDITELPVSDNIEDFTSLPAVGKDGRLKRFNVNELRKKLDGGSNVELVQETGQSEDKAMSQKATTAAIAAATTTNDGKNLQEVYEVSKTAATRASQAQSTIEVVQERGEATDKPMSQKAVSDALAQIEKKAEDNATAITSISASGGVPIAQEAGDSATKVMSQKAITEALKNISLTTDDGNTLQDVYEKDKYLSNQIDAVKEDIYRKKEVEQQTIQSIDNTFISETQKKGKNNDFIVDIYQIEKASTYIIRGKSRGNITIIAETDDLSLNNIRPILVKNNKGDKVDNINYKLTANGTFLAITHDKSNAIKVYKTLL